MKKSWLFTSLNLIIVLAIVGVLLIPPHKATASFNPNLIMDDYTFSNSGSMSAGQIDAFLNAFPKSCISSNPNTNGNWGFRTADPTGWSASEPNNHGYTFGGQVTAGQAIYDAARIYHLNPQMILATMQKEQSIVTGNAGCHYTNPQPGMACTYDGGGCVFIGMSYACPGTCNYSYDGFSLQLIAASWLLRFAQERSLGVTSGYAGYDQGDSNLGYGGAKVGVPYTLADGNTVTVQSGASGSLYYFTPFYSGNRSFVSIFESWFGPTSGAGYELVMDSSCASACAQYVVYGSIKQYVGGAVKAAWGLPDLPQAIDHNVLNSYSTGPDLGVLATVNNNPVKAVYFMDGGKRYRLPGGNFMDTWDFRGKVVSDVSPGLFTLPADAGDLYNVIKNPANSTYYMMDGVNGSGQEVLRPFANDTVRSAWEGTLHYTPISAAYFDNIDNAIGGTLSSTSASCLGTNFQVMNGAKLIQSTSVGALFPSPASVSLATYNRLVNIGNMTSIIKTPDDPAVYLVDNSTKRHITGGGFLTAWAAGQDITKVNADFLNALTTGADIDSFVSKDASNNYYLMDRGNKYPVPSSLTTAYNAAWPADTVTATYLNQFATGNSVTGFVQGINQPAVYLLDNSGGLRRLPNPTAAGLWGAYQMGITQISPNIVSTLTVGSDAKTYVSNGTTNYLMDVGKPASISTSVAGDWGLSSPMTFSDGTLSRFSTAAAIGNQVYDGQTYYYIRGAKAYTTTDPNVAGMWGLIGSAIHNGSLVFSTMSVSALSPFVQSSTNSSNYYIVDNGGTWYHMPSSQMVANIIGSSPLTVLNPSYAPSTINDWAGVVVKNGTDYYALDGGAKRYLPNNAIRSQWTNGGTHTDQSVDTYFLNYLPTGPNMERAIIGSGPAVYSVENETKRHITSSATLQSYLPLVRVSDTLINALSSGSDLP